MVGPPPLVLRPGASGADSPGVGAAGFPGETRSTDTPPHRPLEAFYFTDPDGNVLEARYYE